jgi:L-rhamnose mutarotase
MTQRMGMCIGLNADKVEEYKRLHAAVWPDVLARIAASNIRNYSIFLREPENFLFAYWEYTGPDFAADMAAIAADPATQRWWVLCMPCQQPLATRAEGEWWAGMEEVFHTD